MNKTSVPCMKLRPAIRPSSYMLLAQYYEFLMLNQFYAAIISKLRFS